MTDDTTLDDSKTAEFAAKDRWQCNWAIGGFVLSFLPVAFIGVMDWYQEIAHAAALPPGTGACGMGAAAAVATIIVLAPIAGMIGSAAGWLAGSV